MALRRMSLAATVFAAACSPAYADQPIAGPGSPPPQIALDIAPPRFRAPYDVQIIRSNGESLPTYGLRDRFYVQGSANERYTIRITNPTDRRIEAVVSVDGLDVIDGENGDLRKRGYVVPAYGETRIEGFRTSQSDVATFRFSSVSGSYAGQKGKARNVGVIAVALFEEQEQQDQQVIIGDAVPPPRPMRRRRYDAGGGRESATAPVRGNRVEATSDRPSTASSGAPRSRPDKRAAEAPADVPSARPVPPVSASADGDYAPPADDSYDEEDLAPPAAPQLSQRQPRERPGLGTEFGEQRASAASFTRFVRAPGRPVAIAELRYNDTAGLIALGIPVQPVPDPGEIMTRETADPFPGDRFARPPR
jgi:hypothetical protein